jgi:hypothetical protein
VRAIVCRGYSPCMFPTSGDDLAGDSGDEEQQPFWPAALALLNEQSYVQSSEGNKGTGNGGSTGLGSQLAQIREYIGDCLKWEPDARPDIKAVRHRLRPLHKGM